MRREIFRKTFNDQLTVSWTKDGKDYRCYFYNNDGEIVELWDRLRQEDFKRYIRKVLKKKHVVDE